MQRNKKKAQALDKAKNFFEYANGHPMINLFRAKAIEDFGFQDGTRQWSKEAAETLKKRGQAIITVNKIKNLVNYMSGVEIQTRFRVAFRSHSGKVEDDRLAKALTHLGYAIQENQNMSHQASWKFRDALITGIGWSNLYKDPNGGEIRYEYVNPLNVLFDPDDLSPNLDEMTFVCRVRWLPLYRAEMLWPQHKAYFKRCFNDIGNLEAGNYSDELAQRQSGYVDLYSTGDGDPTRSRKMIVEVQYRDTQPCFEGIDQQGHYFETFEEAEAELLQGEDTHLAQKPATRIMRVLFTGDALLEYGPLDPVLPNLPDFTYIPCVWSRRFEDGVPDGWISVMKDIQRESNARRSRLFNNLNSRQVIMDADALGPGKDAEDVRQELKRTDSVLFKKPGSELNIESNQSLAPAQFEMLARSDQELQQVSGIYDEALGKETNAQSGIAIQNRQINSVRNQIFGFDNLRLMKKREARMMLNLIQGGGDEFMEAQILTEEETASILLNVVREVQGQKIIFNDIRTLPLSIYVEEVPDFESSLQEQQAALEELLGNPNAMFILQSPALLKRLGFRDYEDLSREMMQIKTLAADNEAMQQVS